MVSLTSLAVPIVLSAVLVFLVSSVIHMVLSYHQTDFARLPDEDAVAEALRKTGAQPGDYAMPFCDTPASMKDPKFQEKLRRGPNGIMTIWAGGDVNMGPMLGQWFGFALLVSFFTAYILSVVFAAGADYLAVFRIAGTVSFMAYSFGAIPASIWYKRSWSTTFKSLFDGLIYGLMTAGAFGWLWP